MKRFLITAAVSTLLSSAAYAETLVVSSWGGSFRDLIDQTIAAKFTEETGVEVEFITGGTIDRLNQAMLMRDMPESDVTFTTSHIGWLYNNDGLFEELDMSRIPNAANLVEQAKISPSHIGAWAYVYTIGYLPDALPEGFAFESWEDLWSPELEGMVAAPDFDPSHIIAVASRLEGVDIEDWEQATDKLLALRPNFRAFYTNDANSQQLMTTGETPVQILLSMNAYYMQSQGIDVQLAIPQEGAVLGIDTMGITAGTDKVDLAYQFINAALDPEVQAQIAEIKKGIPVVSNVELPEELAALPGIFTSPEQWDSEALIIPHELRAEKTAEWRQWFSENMIAGN
ncbi:ABC transporter substrate-binding protein [Pelagibacterium halotolerans]|uniref:ABC transporter, periplasmic spermidine putrescine-binding protein PotD n=1 Tax=Pelagibacterium halotolerans (strain DSM 22347 / JCM 15775 / CGMCC 1.7692 / B2) TaxID=1082931 RepID=G4RCG4_PELHB|nr:ABC transporter substrate-binding protein [Pelagibacterium halotolerans]AEQ53758.1 ABC transporter, periplasmic spermidine putrescine-binding protein PotD [Pelagibacterium halotolerans B2]QJR20082.1 ABC transporter substrate-binding protein [Pelagibacterium halotolerans]SEA80386.1 putative spermidine/putrescine transport system substrate-binding protein [Pelagibacterium halotolerans]